MKHTLETIIRPALAHLASQYQPPRSGTFAARPAEAMLLAIAKQESDLTHRWQVIDRRRPDVKGPARGLWQMERGGGVKGVLTHSSSAVMAHKMCRERGVDGNNQTAVWVALETDDILAAMLARLLLWTDWRSLPTDSSPAAAARAFEIYEFVWRPGALKRDYTNLRNKFLENYRQAWGAVK